MSTGCSSTLSWWAAGRRISRRWTGRSSWSCWRPGPSTPGSSTSATGVDEALAAARLRAAGCVFAEEEARLIMAAARTPDELDAMVERRAGGLPLEQVIGWAEFCGLRIAVDPGVFVPRLRTEFLVRQAVLLLREPPGALARPGAIVVDLCCGTGAIGAAIAAALGSGRGARRRYRPGRRALRPAERQPPGTWSTRATCTRRCRPGCGGQVAVLAANVPYVPTNRDRLPPAGGPGP